MSHPYGVARTQSGERTTSASGIHARRRARTSSTSPSSIARPAPRTTEPWRFAQRTRSGRTSSVRSADAAPRRRRRAARGRRRRAGARPSAREASSPTGRRGSRGSRSTKVERDDAPPVRAVANARPSASRTKRDPEEDHGAHAREPVGGVEDDLGEPLLVGPRAPLAEDGQVLGVREAVLDDLASGHQRQPRVADDDRRREDREEDDSDQADEQDREGARLEDAADSAPGVRLQSDTCRSARRPGRPVSD